MNKCRFYTKNDILRAVGHIKQAAPTDYLGKKDNRTDKTYGNMTDTVDDQNARDSVYGKIEGLVQPVAKHWDTITDTAQAAKDMGQSLADNVRDQVFGEEHNDYYGVDNPSYSAGNPEYASTDPASAPEFRGQNESINNQGIDVNALTQQIQERIGKGLTPQEAQTAITALNAAVQTGEAVQPYVQAIVKRVTGVELPTLEAGNSTTMLNGTSNAIKTYTNGAKVLSNGAKTWEDLSNGNYVDAAGDAANTVGSIGKTIQSAGKTLDATKKVFDNTYVANMANNATKTLEKMPGFKKVKAITDLSEIGAIIKDPSIKSFLEHSPSIADGLAQLGIKIAGPAGEIVAAYKTGQDLGEWVANTTGMTDAAQNVLPDEYARQSAEFGVVGARDPNAMDYAKTYGRTFINAADAERKALGNYINTATSSDNTAILNWYNKQHGTNHKAMTQQMYEEAWRAGATPTQIKRREREQEWRQQEQQKQEEARARSDKKYQAMKLQAQTNPEWGLKNGVISQKEYTAIKLQQLRMHNWYRDENRRVQGGQAGPVAPVPSPSNNFLDYYAQR